MVTTRLLATMTIIEAVMFPLAANAGTFTTLYTFEGGAAGANPALPLLYHDGELYGILGGAYGAQNDYYGAVYKVNVTTGSYKVVHGFTGGVDGSFPSSSVIYQDGMLYGTTKYGGGGCTNNNPAGCGTIFSVNARTGTETVINDFSQDTDAPGGVVALVFLAEALYGIAAYGGANNSGSAFTFNPATNSFATLYNFDGAGGLKPNPQLLYENGLFYGTTRFGGSGCLRDGGCGTVFSLDPTTGAEAVLYRFKGYYGEFPNSNLSYHAGSLIGDTSAGGNRACERGCGINFKIKATTGRETVLEDFGSGGENYSGITVVNGNAYETLPSGGSGNYGELLEVNLKSGQKTVLYTFTGGPDGGDPEAPLTYHNGAFYGSTFSGGNDSCLDDHGCGTVFKFVP